MRRNERGRFVLRSGVGFVCFFFAGSTVCWFSRSAVAFLVFVFVCAFLEMLDTSEGIFFREAVWGCLPWQFKEAVESSKGFLCCMPEYFDLTVG